MAIIPKDEVSRTIREEPPTHFTLRIDSFSLISGSSLQRYDSAIFEAGGYKWKLCLYPEGNEDRNGKDHISLYLEIVETDSLSPGWEVHALFRFLVLDQLRDNYLLIQDASGIPRRFRATKTRSGLDRFITLKDFNDPNKGYLVNDTCMFGAEVFVHRESVTGKGECLSMKAGPLTCNHTWKIERFSELDEESYSSEVFTAGGHKWKIRLYPKGHSEEKGKGLSLFLELHDLTTLLPDRGVYVDFQLRVVDQIHGEHEVHEKLSRTIRDEPPTHFTLQIKSFSLISITSLERYDSGIFEAGGYKWKLCLYPKGNMDRNGEGHISLYLEMVETDSFSLGWEVHALFRFFVLDQLRDNYLLIQDARGIPRRFRATKIQSGFDRFITLKEFKEPSMGYLVNDTCIFGAEIFVYKESVTGKGECLSMTTEPLTCNHTWKIERFSELNKESYKSEVFTAGGHKWNILLYPKGNSDEKGKGLSLFLELHDLTTLIPDRGVYVDFQLRVVDQIHGEHKEVKLQHWFNKSEKDWGQRKFLPLSSFLDQSKGYLVKDVCIIEAHLLIIGAIKKLSPKSE